MSIDDSKYRVRVRGLLSREISIRKGLRQGVPIALLHFNLVLDRPIKKSRVGLPGSIINISIQGYTDDAITDRSMNMVREIFEDLDREAKAVGWCESAEDKSVGDGEKR